MAPLERAGRWDGEKERLDDSAEEIVGHAVGRWGSEQFNQNEWGGFCGRRQWGQSQRCSASGLVGCAAGWSGLSALRLGTLWCNGVSAAAYAAGCPHMMSG